MLEESSPFGVFFYISRATEFRWIQKEGTGERQSWGVDHVYIGEACPGLCSGHGYCTSGAVCICDEGHHGGPQAETHKTTSHRCCSDKMSIIDDRMMRWNKEKMSNQMFPCD